MEQTMTATVPVRVAGELVIKLDEIPEMALAAVKGALTIENEEKAKAAELRRHGWWDMADTVSLWREEARRGGEKVICLPRGFAMALESGLAEMGITVAWDDQRTKSPAADGYFRQFVLRDYQLEAVVDILKYGQGVYRAPAGSGKTVTSLGAMAYANQRTLVIVDKAGLVEQWRARAARFFGFPTIRDENGFETAVLTKGATDAREAGKIGQGVWEERDLTICLRQTLYERSWSMDATKWWGNWGAVWFDECHHLAADSLAEICRKVTSFYMTGVSATPAKSPAKAKIVHALVGPLIHDTPRQVLYDLGVLMKPTIEVLEGDFFAHFHKDHEATFDGETKRWTCQAHGCKKQGKHRHNNNYSSVLKKLVEDGDRNARIVSRIMTERGHHHLIPSSQLKHLNLIRRALLDAGWPPEKIWLLRGEENAKGLDQQIAQEFARADEGVILSTVAGEALDIPPIDRVHICFPMRDHGATIQLVGRGERVADGKSDSIVIDYREPLTDVFEGQFDERATVYRMQSYNIISSPYNVSMEEAASA